MLVELVVQPYCNWLRQQNIFKLFNISSEAIMRKKTRDTRRLGLSSLFMTGIAMYMASCAMFFRPSKRGIFVTPCLLPTAINRFERGLLLKERISSSRSKFFALRAYPY